MKRKESGDSGAPVYYPVYSNYVAVYGIHWGRVGYAGRSYAVFSPVSGIEADLGAVPMTV